MPLGLVGGTGAGVLFLSGLSVRGDERGACLSRRDESLRSTGLGEGSFGEGAGVTVAGESLPAPRSAFAPWRVSGDGSALGTGSMIEEGSGGALGETVTPVGVT